MEKPKSCSSPELVLENVDFAVHGVGRLGGVLQLTLQFPAVGVGPLRLLLRLLQLTLQLLHARVQLLSLNGNNEETAMLKNKNNKL